MPSFFRTNVFGSQWVQMDNPYDYHYVGGGNPYTVPLQSESYIKQKTVEEIAFKISELLEHSYGFSSSQILSAINTMLSEQKYYLDRIEAMKSNLKHKLLQEIFIRDVFRTHSILDIRDYVITTYLT